jgi:N-acetylglucosaminyl-diphospho-decaprenol L-rhamnosyltransferase
MTSVSRRTIDVVMVTTNARDVLASSLEHLRRQTAAHTIYLSDNASGDGTAAMVRERFPEVRLIENAANLGFGRSCNNGARAGSGEVIVLVNDDMDVEPEFLERLVAPLEDPRVGMVAGLTLQPQDGVVDGFGIELDPTLNAYNRLRHRAPTESPGRLLGPSGGAAAYRREAWEAAGGFDEAFFVYGEDVDLALRLRLAGWEAAAALDARGVHLGGATTGAGSPFQRRNAGFARGFILRRYGILRGRHAPRALLAEALVVGWGLVRHRTTVPLRARIDGWRAAGARRLAVPPGAVDATITLRETVRRLAFAR